MKYKPFYIYFFLLHIVFVTDIAVLSATHEDIRFTISLLGSRYLSPAKIFDMIGHSSTDTVDSKDIEKFITDIVHLYLSNGFLFVRVYIKDISLKDGICHAIVRIDEGQIVRANHIIISGNHVTRDNIILRESKIKRDQIITTDDLRSAERSLTSKRYIMSARVLPVDEGTILIDILEDKMTHLSATVGFSSSAEKKNNFTGVIQADFQNILGTDRSIAFSYHSFENINATSIRYHESGPLTVPIAGDFSLSRTQRKPLHTTTEVAGDIYYYYATQKLGVATRFVGLYPEENELSGVEKQSDRMLGMWWTGNFTDDIYNPTTGWDLGFRQYNVFVKRDTQKFSRARVGFSISHFLPLPPPLVLKNTLRCQHLQNKSLKLHDLLKTGGTNSIRGFYEDQFFGNTIVYTNTELRYQMTRDSRALIFLDWGYVEDNRPQVMSRAYDLVGMGMGLRVKTQIGMLILDYGFSHANKKWMSPINGIVHIGIESSF
jgi:outer membrane protein assembly factor BamA